MTCPTSDVRHTRRLRFIVYMSVVSLEALTWSAAALCRHIPRRACGIDHLDPVSLPVCLPRLTHYSFRSYISGAAHHIYSFWSLLSAMFVATDHIIIIIIIIVIIIIIIS